MKLEAGIGNLLKIVCILLTLADNEPPQTRKSL